MEGSAIAPFAWFFMLLSMGSVTVLTAYCYIRILSGSEREDEGGGAQPDASDS
ncbi:MAG: hypothetical protein JSV95_02970 [Gemmatimonadota bacterium]|nr:MAG: hypothetical protein JSV95_02970 [Gemmatimonadota bacterium]